MKKIAFKFTGLVVIASLIFVGCSKKDDSKPSTSSTSSTSSTASTTSTGTTSSTSSTTSTSSSSSSSSTNSTSSGSITVDGTTTNVITNCEEGDENYSMAGATSNASKFCALIFSAKPTASKTYTIAALGQEPSADKVTLSYQEGSMYFAESGNVTVTVTNGVPSATFSNIAVKNISTTATKIISGTLRCN